MPVDFDSNAYDGLLTGYRQHESYDASDDEKRLVRQLNSWFEEASNAKRVYEREWEVHRAYLKGDVVARHRDTGDIVRLSQEDSKRLRSRNNMLRPIARSLVGKLAKMIPTCTVVPSTSDFGDQAAAKVGDAFFQYLRRKEDLDAKYLAACNFLPWAGNSFLELEWDPQDGAKIAYCDICNYYSYNADLIGTPCPNCQQQRQSELQQQQMAHEAHKANMAVDATMQLPISHEPVQPEEFADTPPPPLQQQGPLPTDQEVPPLKEANEGDVCVKVRDPRDVFIPPGAETIKQCTRICVREAVEVAVARARFPQHAQFIHREEGIFSDKQLRWRYNLLDTHGTINYLSDHVFIYTYHEKPTTEFPNGRLIRKVNDMIVENVESPYHCLDRVPLYHLGFDANDGEFWREPFLQHAWHRQRELDNLETKIREHIELLLAQKWLIPTGSRISADEITAQTAQVIEYNAAAGNPRVIDVPAMPQQAWDRKNDLVQDMRVQASVTEQEQGLTTSDPNGRAMAIINAEADQATGPITTRNHGEWRELHHGALLLVQKNYHPERKITVVGPDGAQTYSFDQANLYSAQDVQIEEQDGLSRNPAIRFNETLQLAQVGGGAFFIDMKTGQFDKKSFARMAKLKIPDLGYDAEATERAAAQSIPYLLMKGLSYQPQEFDDPAIFAEELMGWLRGPGRQSDPQLTQAVKQVWMYYQQWIAMQQQGQGMPNPAMLGQMGQPSQPGAGNMSAPGGTPNNPGMLGTDLAPGLDQEAENRVAGADQFGDMMAQGMSHES